MWRTWKFLKSWGIHEKWSNDLNDLGDPVLENPQMFSKSQKHWGSRRSIEAVHWYSTVPGETSLNVKTCGMKNRWERTTVRCGENPWRDGNRHVWYMGIATSSQNCYGLWLIGHILEIIGSYSPTPGYYIDYIGNYIRIIPVDYSEPC